ncbi:hypothetical protein B0H13DRAFT_1871214 [Mycena leptocephala]|nr:hypothetical protein B0H13DRAFT_1871214 [Mycena leptocephala]
MGFLYSLGAMRGVGAEVEAETEDKSESKANIGAGRASWEGSPSGAGAGAVQSFAPATREHGPDEHRGFDDWLEGKVAGGYGEEGVGSDAGDWRVGSIANMVPWSGSERDHGSCGGSGGGYGGAPFAGASVERRSAAAWSSGSSHLK